MTSTGYLLTTAWDATMYPGQIYDTAASCTGTAYLNSGSANAPPAYAKTVVFSRAFNSPMVTDETQTDGTALHVRDHRQPGVRPQRGDAQRLAPRHDDDREHRPVGLPLPYAAAHGAVSRRCVRAPPVLEGVLRGTARRQPVT